MTTTAIGSMAVPKHAVAGERFDLDPGDVERVLTD
jgi:hypothetical protein